MRIEPPPSVPSVSGPMPAAAATAAPPLEPPGVAAGSHGLRVMPVSGLSVTAFQPNSGVVVLPSSTAPASRSRAVAGASSASGAAPAVVRLPRSVGQPRVRMMSLIDAGTPSSGPRGSPRGQRASEARAAARAPSSIDHAERADGRRSSARSGPGSPRPPRPATARAAGTAPGGRRPNAGPARWRPCSPPSTTAVALTGW